jgi:hypothetical protein
MELKEPLGLGADFKSEHTALKRSVSELHKQLSVARLSALAADDGDLTMEAFRKVDGALLSPISILDYLLSEEAAQVQRR